MWEDFAHFRKGTNDEGKNIRSERKEADEMPVADLRVSHRHGADRSKGLPASAAPNNLFRGRLVKRRLSPTDDRKTNGGRWHDIPDYRIERGGLNA